MAGTKEPPGFASCRPTKSADAAAPTTARCDCRPPAAHGGRLTGQCLLGDISRRVRVRVPLIRFVGLA